MSTPPSVGILNRDSRAGEIESSKNHIIRHSRALINRYIVSTTSLLLTFTSYSITTTTITSRVTLGATTAVSCLPSGITIC